MFVIPFESGVTFISFVKIDFIRLQYFFYIVLSTLLSKVLSVMVGFCSFISSKNVFESSITFFC